MPAYFTSGLCVGQGSWHGQENLIGEGSDLYRRLKAGEVPTEELLTLAGLNYRIEKAKIAMRPVGYTPLPLPVISPDGTLNVEEVRAFLQAYATSMDTGHLTNYRAIRRADTGHVYQISKDRYQVVQNEQIVDFFREFCNAGHATVESMGSLKDGAVVWCLARLGGQASIVLNGLDELRGYMLLATSHDGSLTTTGRPTQVRVVCWNTLSAALELNGKPKGGTKRKEKTFRMRHSRKFDAVAKAEALEVMGMAIEKIAATNTLSAKLAQVHIDAEGRLEFLDRLLKSGSLLDAVVADSAPASGSDLLAAAIGATETNNRAKLAAAGLSTSEREEKLSRVGKAVLESILTSPGADLPTAHETAWGLVNGVTYYADKSVKADNEDNRLFSTWFGPGEILKTNALKIAVDMSGINLSQFAA
jgi:phage/plasmid-like protein (TIGR03299 family)